MAAPCPAMVPGAGYWTLETAFEHPRQITLQVNGEKAPRRFWYILLAVTNNLNKDVDFFARCDLMTDTFQVLPAGSAASVAVFEKIKKIHQNKYPFLESLEKTSCKILQGKDNSRDIAIIWPDFDAKARSVKFFITGLSNETAVIDHPVEKGIDGGARKIYLRKSLELDYAIGTDPALRDNAKLICKGKRWIMR
ncbi:MAG: hypothetical protein ACYSRZ_06510 [Planctomycetota bacterium]